MVNPSQSAFIHILTSCSSNRMAMPRVIYYVEYFVSAPSPHAALKRMPRTAHARFIAWSYNTGHVCDEMMREHLHPPDPLTLCLLCGPPPMVNYTCIPGLERLGHRAEQRFSY